MTQKIKLSNRFVENRGGIIGPIPRRDVNIRIKQPGDYPSTPQAYIDAAQLFGSSDLRGPGISDELMALVQHLLTEEEVSIVRHLKTRTKKFTAEEVAGRNTDRLKKSGKFLTVLPLKKG